MTIFERYVFRQAGGALLIILLSLSASCGLHSPCASSTSSTSQGQDVWMLVKMTTLALPNLMAIIAPFSLLIATIAHAEPPQQRQRADRAHGLGRDRVERGAAADHPLACSWRWVSPSSIIWRCPGACGSCAITSCRYAPTSLRRSFSRGSFPAPRTISPSTSASAHSTASSSASSCTTAATRRRPSPTSPSTASS